MTNDWPRDPARLAELLYERMDAVVIRQMNRGGGQNPLHVPAVDVDLGERKRPLPDDADETTPLCAGYSKDGQYRETIRKPIETQSNRTRWCSKCAAILVDLHPHKHFAANVERGALADGGDPIRSKDDAPHGDCPLCGEAYTGFLPNHIRDECEGAA